MDKSKGPNWTCCDVANPNVGICIPACYTRMSVVLSNWITTPICKSVVSPLNTYRL